MPARPTPIPESLRARPFTAGEARAAGVSAKVLRGRSVRRLYHAVYVAADLPLTLAVRVRAALLILPPDAVAAGVTALQLLGIDLGPSEPLRFLTTSVHQVKRPGLVVTRVRRLPPRRRGRLDAEAAFVGAASTLNLLDLVAAGDRLVRKRLLSVESLNGYTATVGGRGSVHARRAARLVRARVDSVQETRLRLAIVLAGLPEPECNIALGSDEWFIGTPDLVYQKYRVIVEYEGDQHRKDREQWNYDIGRYEEFTDEGWTIIRVTSARMRHSRLLIQRIDRALRAGGYAGPPAAFNEEWLALFA